MNKISDRRKKNPNHLLLNNEDQSALIRMSTNVQLVNHSPPTIQQMQKRIHRLQKSYKQQIQARVEAEQNLKLHQIRSIAREKQFHKILEETDQKVRSYVRDSESSTIIKQIKKYYERIFQSFEKTNQATTFLIESKYRQSMASMERRIDLIMQQFNSQLNKNKVISNESINQIRRQIEQALNFVRCIQNENQILKNKMITEKNKNKILEEERKLLIQQVVYKKMVIVKIFEENKKLKQKIFQFEKKENSPKAQDKSVQLYQNQKNALAKFQTMLSNNLQMMETKETTVEKQLKGKFEAKSLDTTPIKNKILYQNRASQSRQKMNASSESKINGHSKIDDKNQHVNMFGTSTFPSRKSSYGQKFSRTKLERKFTKQSLNRKRKLLYSQNQGHMITMARNQTIKTESEIEDQNHNQKTIDHLKKCLQRQKKKVLELGKLNKVIKNRNEQVNQALLQMLRAAKLKSEDDSQQLANFLRCQQLLKLITDMKKRLAMCQNPNLNCGWGDLQIESLLNSIGG